MEVQKLLKPKGKIVIVSDYREKEIIENLKKLGAAVNEQPLEVGDFAASERVIIERKTHGDFISSIIDGRIFEQAKAMKENFEKPIILIEGYSDRQINENALKGAMASMLVDFEISVISTKNPMDTAKTIYWIAKKEQIEGRGVGIKVGKKPKSEREIQEFIVGSIPGVSTTLAKRLLEHFGSVEGIFNASEQEFLKVRGMKKSVVKKIRNILTSNY